MTSLRLSMLLVACATALAGCFPTCQDACANVVSVCAEQFKQAGIQFSESACVTDCEKQTGDCAIEQRVCVSEAPNCTAIGECPKCP
ncbi:MAG: hypothetical protein ACK4N5_03335 [Myxococcales bacterium]